jgi:peptidylprolyl isomerase/FKBP-type peptidyl-prolyl cis-trans isomerase FklB
VVIDIHSRCHEKRCFNIFNLTLSKEKMVMVMKKLMVLAIPALLMFPAVGFTADKAKPATELTSFQDKLSYSMGLDVGTYFKGMKDDINYDRLILGITDSFKGNKQLLTPEEVASVQKEFAAKMQEKQAAQLKEMQEKNKKSGDEYLAKNKEKKGVEVTKSGLQYEVVKKGNGEKVKDGDQVKVHYTGTFVDGKTFDDSRKRGEPAVFGVDQVIPGWSEALKLMDVGSQYKLAIPSSIAYGEQGAPPVIEPNSVLLFDVELIAIEKKDEKPAEAPAAPAAAPAPEKK